ncbi:sensory transduction histidine kinase [Halosimplex carlsbadense 2-9-1]|uniref:histidine kinase n=1 Tax=Halosimplex carlsbadense 2-9-1 TaxID=797114 RepID=M0CRA8_9EURY|nr:PAS domain S-box protein [Halosimplex carlsbadense]ELZ24409.1 sensory transduction histidine kinase [Halosimplex carlsbadense 2-9-1]
MGDKALGDALYRDVFEAAADPIFLHDADTGEIVDANAAAADLVGVEREAVVGAEIGAFSPPEYTNEEAARLVETARDTGEESVSWTLDDDGRTHSVDVLLKRATLDGEVYVLAFVTDVTEHRAIQERYRTERDMLDRLLDISPVGIVIHGAEGTILKTNEQAEEILGVDRGEIVGGTANPDEISVLSVDGDPIDTSSLPFRSVADTGESVDERELTIERPDGERAVVSVSGSPLFDEDGALKRVVVSIADVTDRRQRERERKQRNEQLRTLVTNLPVVVFTLDPQGVFQHSAGKGLEALGLEPGELEGESVFDAYATEPDIVDAVRRALDGEEVRATQEVSPFTFETWYRPVRDDEGELELVVGVARDVSALKDRENRMQDLAQATQELPHVHTERETASAVVDIADAIIGYPVTVYWDYDAETDRLEPLVASDRALELVEAVEAAGIPDIGSGSDEMDRFKTGDLSVVENYSDLANPAAPRAEFGTVVLVPIGDHGLLSVGALEETAFDEYDRNLVEILAQSAVDTLDRIERERELEASKRELERSNESLQQFAYVASHDLQEPLRMVSSYVSLLEAEYGHCFDEEAEEYMDFAVDGATRMQEMIDALLQYSRVHTRGDEFVEVDTGTVFAETVKSLELLVEDHSATVEVGDLPPVRADRSQLGQVFQNLLKNAIEHGGDEPSVAVTATREGERVRFDVTDDGEGIPESQHERIFEIFKGDGTGIGLAMCKRIVERHEGEIRVESAPGEGATFRFTMPAVDDVSGAGDIEPMTVTDGDNQ